jgi:hypothetical protein
VDETILSLNKMEIYKVEFIGVQFQIRTDVMKMIKSKYLSEKTIIFHVSTVSMSRLSGLPLMVAKVTGHTSFTVLLCQAVSYVDTNDILPFGSHYVLTVCFQSWVREFQLSAGEYQV